MSEEASLRVRNDTNNTLVWSKLGNLTVCSTKDFIFRISPYNNGKYFYEVFYRNDKERMVHRDYSDFTYANAKLVCQDFYWGVLTRMELAINFVEETTPKEEEIIHEESQEKPVPKQETILQEADRIVVTDRQDDYGHPFLDFTRTGRMWGAILGIADIAPETVGIMMVALKLGREVNKHKRDNLVDVGGYAKTVDLVHDYRSKHINDQ